MEHKIQTPTYVLQRAKSLVGTQNININILERVKSLVGTQSINTNILECVKSLIGTQSTNTNIRTTACEEFSWNTKYKHQHTYYSVRRV